MKKRLRWALVLLAGLLLLMLTACNDETDVPITSDAQAREAVFQVVNQLRKEKCWAPLEKLQESTEWEQYFMSLFREAGTPELEMVKDSPMWDNFITWFKGAEGLRGYHLSRSVGHGTSGTRLYLEMELPPSALKMKQRLYECSEYGGMGVLGAEEDTHIGLDAAFIDGKLYAVYCTYHRQ